MTLFKSLVNTPLGDSSSSSSSSSSPINKTPAFPPTAIQLYSTKYIHFISNTIQTFKDDNDINNTTSNSNEHAMLNSDNGDGSGNGNGNVDENDLAKRQLSKQDLKTLPKRFEILSYQPVHVSSTSSGSSSSRNRDNSSSRADNNMNVPNLGIWDCRSSSSLPSPLNSSLSSTSFLLKSALYQYSNSNNTGNDNGNDNSNNNDDPKTNKQKIKPTFLLTIDLSTNIENVQPTLSTMMNSIHQTIQQQQQEEEEQKQKLLQKQQKDEGGNKDNTNEKEEGMDSKEKSKSQEKEMKNLPKFGVAAKHEPKNNNNNSINMNDKANIIISAILPSMKNNSNLTYKEKQGLNLVLYHLFKYSNKMNCTLCFLKHDYYNIDNDDDSSDIDNGNGNGNEEGEEKVNSANDNDNSNNNNTNDNAQNMMMNGLIPNGMNVNEFKYVVREICLGDEKSLLSQYGSQQGMKSSYTNNDKNDDELGTINEEEEEEEDEGEGETKEENNSEGEKVNDDNNENNDNDKNSENQKQSSIYFPNGYDVDLIDSVYLRSASCAGVWDANSDDLWVALPSSFSTTTGSPRKASRGGSKNSNSGFGGDEEWLSKLADSVSAYTNSSFGAGGTRSIDGSKSVMMEEASIKSSRTKIKDGSSVVTTSTKTKARGGRKKPTSNASKKSNGKDDVSDFFSDLLKN